MKKITRGYVFDQKSVKDFKFYTCAPIFCIKKVEKHEKLNQNYLDMGFFEEIFHLPKNVTIDRSDIGHVFWLKNSVSWVKFLAESDPDAGWPQKCFLLLQNEGFSKP